MSVRSDAKIDLAVNGPHARRTGESGEQEATMGRLVPPGAAERFVPLPEGRVRVLVGGATTGGRTPAVLIHGAGDASGISWFRSFASLGTDRRVIAIDLPGFGGTTEIPPLGGPEHLADFVVRVAGELKVPKAVVVGVSMGGDVALNVALRHPDFTGALILIGSGGLAERVGGRVTHFFAWLGAQIPDRILLPLARVANRFSGSVLKAIVKDPATIPPEVVEEFVRESRAPRAGLAYGRYNQATLGRRGLLNDLTSRVHEISVPTLLFHGADDPIVSPEGSRRAAELMPNARLVLAPDTGHWAQLEAHDLFTDEVRRFLAEAEPTPPAR